MASIGQGPAATCCVLQHLRGWGGDPGPLRVVRDSVNAPGTASDARLFFGNPK
jgi:hypothetical protein